MLYETSCYILFVDSLYNVEMYKNTYTLLFNPLHNESPWNVYIGPNVELDPLKWRIG
jgi:hypothetical protein